MINKSRDKNIKLDKNKLKDKGITITKKYKGIIEKGTSIDLNNRIRGENKSKIINIIISREMEINLDRTG